MSKCSKSLSAFALSPLWSPSSSAGILDAESLGVARRPTQGRGTVPGRSEFAKSRVFFSQFVPLLSSLRLEYASPQEER